MSGITITNVKIVGMCSKCRKEGDEIKRDLNGREYEDKEISCVGCAVGRKTMKDEDYLDEQFPKGKTKFREQAMVLLALAREVGKEDLQEAFDIALEENNRLRKLLNAKGGKDE